MCATDNWGKKAIGRKTTGTGRCRYIKDLPRKFKNGFREGAHPPLEGRSACRLGGPPPPHPGPACGSNLLAARWRQPAIRGRFFLALWGPGRREPGTVEC